MAPLSTDEQFQFLISCIKHSSQGKPNFDEVAKECNIVTKGAAAKRYERLLKSHGIAPPSSATSSPTKNGKAADDSESVSPTKGGSTKRKTAAPKAGAKGAPNKRSRKKVAIASAERIVGSDNDDGEDGMSQDEDANSADALVKQGAETEE